MDNFFEILSRTSLRDLSAGRAVNREWNAMSYESYFLRSFCDRTNSKFGMIVPASSWSKYVHAGRYLLINLFQTSRDGNSTPLDFSFIHSSLERGEANLMNIDYRGTKVEAVASPGLVVCSRAVRVNSGFNFQFFVCKPSTKQWQRLPNPRTKFFTDALAMSVVSHSDPVFFKIIRLSHPKMNQTVVKSTSGLLCPMVCELFDSRTWSWKRLKDLMIPFREYMCRGQAVEACGALHWITSNKEVYAFDMNTEEWCMFGLPGSLCLQHIDEYQLVNYKGRLALMVFKDKESCLLELWVINNYVKNKVWTKEKTVNCKSVMKINHLASPLTMYSSDTMVWDSPRGVIIHNLEDDSAEVVKFPCPLYGRDKLILFQTDMESWGLNCEERKPRRRRRRRWTFGAAASSLFNLIGINKYIPWRQSLIILLLTTLLFAIIDSFFY